MPDNIMTTEAAPIFRNRSPEIKDLAMALAKAQAAMTGASKDANNPHFKTKYADLASVWDAVRKPLTDNDIAVVQFPRSAGNGVEIETTIVHGKTGQFMSDVLWVPCTKNDAQGQGSAITYGRRYALMSVTGIAPVEEDDGNAASKRPAGGGQGDALALAKAEITAQTGNGKSTYELTKEKKALALVKDSAKLAISLCQSRPELKEWLKTNKAELAEKLPTADFDSIIEMVDTRWDDLASVAVT